MTSQAKSRRPASTRGGLRSLEGGGGDRRRGRGSRGPRPTLRPVSDRTRTAGSGPARRPGTGRMRKGETPKERGERTRARIADSVLDLLAVSELPPTAKEVAAEAGVSVRLVFHHFEDMDALYRAVAHAQVERHWLGVRAISRDLPLDERIERTVQQRARLFEAIGAVRRKAVTLAARHPDVAEGLELTNTMLRTWLEETFADELRAARRDRREFLGAIEVAASWETWERLRRIQGLSGTSARRVVVRSLRALLAG